MFILVYYNGTLWYSQLEISYIKLFTNKKTTSQLNDVVNKYNKSITIFGWAVYPSSQVLFSECVGNHFRPQK